MAQHYKNPEITKSRIKVFLGWEPFNPSGNAPPGRRTQNLCSRLWTNHTSTPISLSVASPTKPLVKPTRSSLESLPYLPASVGQTFGPTFSTHIFRLDIVIPSQLHHRPVHLIWDSNSEAMVLSADAVPMQGLVGGNHTCRRADYPLFPDRQHSLACASDTLRLYIEISCNGLFGAGRGGDIEPPDMDTYYTLDKCCLAVFNPMAWQLLHDVTLLSRLIDHLPDIPRRAQALQIANQVVNVVNVNDDSTFEAGRKIAGTFLNAQNGCSQSIVHAMLHSHIDLAWLWPMAVTPAKGARTFASHLRLMQLYPECVFVQSQAQLYQWVKDRYPSLWSGICERVKDGHFIPVGGTWVEMDCNIPNGESLVRQFVHGQQFFKDNFSRRCRELWLPDTFGYATQLPQIMKGCGVDYFMTQKLSWNVFNKFPHSSFVWEGLDGSSVLSHMPPADTYNAQAFPEEVLRSANKNKDSGVINSSMMLVGHGDGGGGASPAMLESMRRMKDVDGIPKVKFSSPQTFFKELEDRKEEVPRWVGELYFELHRGTFTTQADTKKNNRQCENLLRDVELLSTHGVIAGICEGQAFQYPSELLDKSWKVVLKNCFHDTLPGSCIGMVYEETKRDYDFVKQTCMQLITKAFDWLGRVNSTQLGDGRCEENGNALENACTSADNGKSEENESEYVNVEGMLFVRGTGWERSDGRPYVMEMESSKAGVLGSKVVAQCSKSGAMTSWPKMCMSEKDVDYTIVALRKKASGMGIIYKPEFVGISKNVEVVSPVSISKCISEGGETEYLLANRLVKARISSSGRLTSLVLCCGKQEREAVSYGQKVDGKWCSGGNRLVMYDDVSQFWCGWDTEVYSFEKAYDIEGANVCEIVDEGPLQVSVGVKYAGTKAGSTIEQFIVLRAESARLDFRTYVDWKESRKILRVLFDTQVRSSYASYDCQFGHVRRTTRFNNSWDIAKFEVVGHQYCDLSEHKFGVALLNDCKYGYSVRDSTMRLSLLRASKSPDEMADVGQHRFTYSILAHWGSFPTRVVLEEAGDLNWPPIFRGVNGEMKGIESKFVLVSGEDGTGLDTAVISSVKRAEGDEGVVVRVYEAMGARGSARLQCPQGMGVSDVFECTMLEDRKERSDISYSEGRNNKSKVEVLMPLTPFQIRTVKIML